MPLTRACLQVAISAGHDDICIKLSDRGGGIARNGMDRLWTYSYPSPPQTAQYVLTMVAMPGTPLPSRK